MHQRIRLSPLIVVAAIALISSDGFCSDPLADERVGRMHAESLRFRCGQRAAWAFSQCCGTPLDYDTTMTSFVVKDNGVSLREITAFLNANGIPCETRCLSPTDLMQTNYPAIVYLAPATAIDKYGHFVVAIAADESGVTVVEPQVGRREKWTWQFFSDRWTGHCIMQLQSHSFDQRALWLGIVLNLIVILCLFLRK